jgi:hypothetical protein
MDEVKGRSSTFPGKLSAMVRRSGAKDSEERSTMNPEGSGIRDGGREASAVAASGRPRVALGAGVTTGGVLVGGPGGGAAEVADAAPATAARV